MAIKEHEKHFGFLLLIFLNSCINKNEYVLHESFKIILEENTRYYMNIAKTYECSNRSDGYTVLAEDVWNIFEVHESAFNKHQKIDAEQLFKLQDGIHKLAKKYKVSIKAQQLTEINDISDNLLIINIENTLLKELEKKIHCDHPF